MCNTIDLLFFPPTYQRGTAMARDRINQSRGGDCGFSAEEVGLINSALRSLGLGDIDSAMEKVRETLEELNRPDVKTKSSRPQ